MGKAKAITGRSIRSDDLGFNKTVTNIAAIKREDGARLVVAQRTKSTCFGLLRNKQQVMIIQNGNGYYLVNRS